MLKIKPISLAALALLSSLSSHSVAQEARRTYIVQLLDEPVATYVGGVKNMGATQPRLGGRINFDATEVQRYVKYLGERQNLVTANLDPAAIIARYDTVLNGFAAQLSDAEVLALQAHPEVLSVHADEAYSLETVSSTEFLGLNAPNGLWALLGGDTSGSKAGEGMVIGIVDGGVWPESPSFADRVDTNGVPTHDAAAALAFNAPPASWKGICVSGPGFDPLKHCNNKLIGARFFSAGFKATASAVHWSEFLDSPRDPSSGTDPVGKTSGHGGHGSHVASTAAGNNGAIAKAGGLEMPATGVAPRARIAAYKVCWTYDSPKETDGTGSKNSCYGSDSVAAIDQAVKDGVNVINFSISGGTSVDDVVEQAFLRASNAGVFVAAAAGNNGPKSDVAHVSPWVTTVAASTHDRVLRGSVTLRNAENSKLFGATVSEVDLPITKLIRAEDAGFDDKAANLCFSDATAATAANQVLLDPVKVAGRIVICTRGTNARIDKSLAVLNAGGVGMVLVDNGSGVVAELHSVPTVHVSVADGATLKAYAVSAGPEASAALGRFAAMKGPAPTVAAFSSRGPNRFDGNLLKPDLAAPGVDVIANVTQAADPATTQAIAAGLAAGVPAWDSYQGTSMASPHVAGLAVLLKQRNPAWSPAMIKSALMTTAIPTLPDGLKGLEDGTLPWAKGAGNVSPNRAMDPGLVYDLDRTDYIKYQCKVNKKAVSPASLCNTVGTLDETFNLNLPSLTFGSVVHSATATRTVTNVGNSTATYTAAANLPGFELTVTPSTFTLAPQAKQSYTVKVSATTAQAGAWSYGELTWTDGAGHVVRSPLTAMANKAISSPLTLSSDRASGSKIFNIKTGIGGKISALKSGLREANLSESVTLTAKALTREEFTDVCKLGYDTASVKVHKFIVPAGTAVARFALRNEDTGLPQKNDFDLLLLKSDGSGAVYSGKALSSESVQVTSPPVGDYSVCVLARSTGDSAETDMSYRLSSWVVSPADSGGKFVVALPPKVIAGGNATIGYSWTGLEAGKRYLGAAQFLDSANVVQAATVLLVEPGPSIPQVQTDRNDANLKR